VKPNTPSDYPYTSPTRDYSLTTWYLFIRYQNSWMALRLFFLYNDC
jgi:hypothetical protein